MARLDLPDCRGHRDTFALSPEDRRELVRRIAEKGASAIDEFIREREAEGDSLIARKVAKLREELMRRAEELRRRLADSFGEKEAAAEAEYRAKLATLTSQEEDLKGRIERLRADERATLDRALRANPVIGLALDRDVAARPPWWRRVLRVLAKILRVVLFPILWLLRMLTPRKAPPQTTIALPSAGALARAGDLYLSDDGFRQAVRSRLRAAPPRERIRRAWERLLGREDYETIAQNAMRQMMAEEADRARQGLRKEEQELSSSLEEILAQERRAVEEQRMTARELAEQREREAAALEEALATMPEAEVKEAIVDELKASGLLRETAGGLMPTLAFLDSFAAIVHADETQGGGRGQADTGDLAEGEGHYTRGPMRSALETARMDIPASLLRARSRHPKVRHLVEDDVVVHREEREGRTHVVLVVDRSGSMEENGRMEAAKRAALALHHAVRSRDRLSRVDLFLMDTSVQPASLRDVWEAEPTGFTNHGAAFRLAREACRRHRGARTLVYIVTDGLPEAYAKDGQDVAGHPEKAMAYAKAQARELSRERGFAGFVMLLLEPEDEMHVKAAEALAKEAGGKVVPVDPQALARTLLRQLDAAPREATA